MFAGDGQLIASWGGVLEAADLPPTMIIGAHRSDDETLRIHEYASGENTAAFAFDPERFAAHETFLSRTCSAGRSRASTSRCPTSDATSMPRSRRAWVLALLGTASVALFAAGPAGADPGDSTRTKEVDRLRGSCSMRC